MCAFGRLLVDAAFGQRAELLVSGGFFVQCLLQQVLSLRAADQPAGEPEQTGGVLPVHLFERAGRVLTAPFRQA